MYTGTLISGLMAAAERVGQEAERQQLAYAQELHEIYSMQIPVVEGEQIFLGAA